MQHKLLLAFCAFFMLTACGDYRVATGDGDDSFAETGDGTSGDTNASGDDAGTDADTGATDSGETDTGEAEAYLYLLDDPTEHFFGPNVGDVAEVVLNAELLPEGSDMLVHDPRIKLVLEGDLHRPNYPILENIELASPSVGYFSENRLHTIYTVENLANPDYATAEGLNQGDLLHFPGCGYGWVWRDVEDTREGLTIFADVDLELPECQVAPSEVDPFELIESIELYDVTNGELQIGGTLAKASDAWYVGSEMDMEYCHDFDGTISLTDGLTTQLELRVTLSPGMPSGYWLMSSLTIVDSDTVELPNGDFLPLDKMNETWVEDEAIFAP